MAVQLTDNTIRNPTSAGVLENNDNFDNQNNHFQHTINSDGFDNSNYGYPVNPQAPNLGLFPNQFPTPSQYQYPNVPIYSNYHPPPSQYQNYPNSYQFQYGYQYSNQYPNQYPSQYNSNFASQHQYQQNAPSVSNQLLHSYNYYNTNVSASKNIMTNTSATSGNYINETFDSINEHNTTYRPDNANNNKIDNYSTGTSNFTNNRYSNFPTTMTSNNNNNFSGMSYSSKFNTNNTNNTNNNNNFNNFNRNYNNNGYNNKKTYYNNNNNNKSKKNYNRYIDTNNNVNINILGKFINNKQIPAPRDEKIEYQLFGGKKIVDPDQKFNLIQSHDGLSLSAINFDHYDEIPIEVTGENIPLPINSFTDNIELNNNSTKTYLDPLLIQNITLSRFNKPTPVQRYSVPIVLNQRDLMACAQTGSGKTGAFLFPILSESFKSGRKPLNHDNIENHDNNIPFPTILILAPTRELVSQIFQESKKFCYRSWLVPFSVYGGTDIQVQIKKIQKHGCDLLVATPGRLNDLLNRKVISLKGIKFLVLDEADRMLDMGFEPQIRNIIQNNDMPDVLNRTTLMFSATFPKDIQLLAKSFLKNYVFLSVGKVGSTSENITQEVLYVEEIDKNSILLNIILNWKAGLTLVFVETKKMADNLSIFLQSESFPAAAIHGDRSQNDREKALRNFRSGRNPILVATAVAARGLDIPNVTHVINYDLPGDIDDYVHRIGRTGRAGNVGHSTAFFNYNNKNIAKGLVQLLTESNQTIPDFLLNFLKINFNNKNKRNVSKNSNFIAKDHRSFNNNYNYNNYAMNNQNNINIISKNFADFNISSNNSDDFNSFNVSNNDNSVSKSFFSNNELNINKKDNVDNINLKTANNFNLYDFYQNREKAEYFLTQDDRNAKDILNKKSQ
ncbi:DEAD-domain-containing protein [Ascoidea rubescens DSM 1968]|uniref:ATP-dependent RNA helicase DED1 n=1 Tax=Ascoidea rubescens DSM 1968 TaxID=1344418 RepID=A0A1D2VAW6_9ASCO|nr:DEAD-domain-containing protein [Ascoidea rubescens DSM 1968]ODV58739.1 DEAD-domain-containing protein [Ascoidea rubescens DSM 1968]